MRSILSDADLVWTGMSSQARASYRNLRREAFSASMTTAQAASVWRQFPVLDDRHWDTGLTVDDHVFEDVDASEVGRWGVRCRDLLVDVESPWAAHNLQGVAVVMRTLAEHIGLGSLYMRASYDHPRSLAGASPWVLGPSDDTTALKWARHRMGVLLSGITLDSYDGLTVLAGFAHPSRFALQAYLDGGLEDTRRIGISVHEQPTFPHAVGVVMTRLLGAVPLLMAGLNDHG